MERRIAPDLATLGLETASRTDRGVHARANALVLRSELPGPAILRILNSLAPDLWFESAAEVSEEFRVRHAERRWYRYFEPRAGGTAARYRAAARLLEGPVDVRSFGRERRGDAPLLRPVDRVRVSARGRWILIDVEARSFVYGMVRKMVATIAAVARGTLSESRMKGAVSGTGPMTLPMAPAERLVLWEVDHGIPWTCRQSRPSHAQARWRAVELERAAARDEILPGLFPPVTGPGEGAVRPRGG